METHTIRIRGFWETVAPGRHRRRFGAPRVQVESAIIWLVIPGLIASTQVELNGEVIGVADSTVLRIDITDKLRPRNELIIVASEWQGDVTLEIVG